MKHTFKRNKCKLRSSFCVLFDHRGLLTYLLKSVFRCFYLWVRFKFRVRKAFNDSSLYHDLAIPHTFRHKVLIHITADNRDKRKIDYSNRCKTTTRRKDLFVCLSQATWPALGGCALHKFGRIHCCVLLNDYLPQNINDSRLFAIIFSRWMSLKWWVMRSQAPSLEHQHASCIIRVETSVEMNSPARRPFNETCRAEGLINNWSITNTANSKLNFAIKRKQM